jgi:O-methyltransferase
MSNILSTLIGKAALRVTYDQIPGDYVEFGCYRGRSLINAFTAIRSVVDNRLQNEIAMMSAEQIESCRAQWQNFRLVGFDSFRGLPELQGVDTGGDDFLPGQYACGQDQVRANLAAAGVDMSKVEFVEGWYKDTCTPATKERLGLKAVSICWLDCDLYQSTKEALDFIADLIGDGTILVFDDWFSFRGSPYRGQQRAFAEFRERLKDGWVFNEFQREASTRVAFFCNRILD